MLPKSITRLFKSILPMVLVLLMATAAAAETWQVDPQHSAAHFSIRHMMVSQVRGMFPDVTGSITFDGTTPTDFDIIIAVDSISTGVDKRDTHLKSKDFFEAATYPTMTFKSTKVEPAGDAYKVTGTMTIKDASRTVTLLFVGLNDARVDPWKMTRRGGTATFTLNRQDYNVSWNAPLDGGGLMVGNDVDIAVDLEVIKPQP